MQEPMSSSKDEQGWQICAILHSTGKRGSPSQDKADHVCALAASLGHLKPVFRLLWGSGG